MLCIKPCLETWPTLNSKALDAPNQWSYCPSIPAAIAMFALFGLTTLCHIFQAFRHRKAFCIGIIMGELWGTLSFAARVISARNPTQKSTYEASFLLVLLAPLFINAFDYMLLGRLMQLFLAWEYIVWNPWVKTGCYFRQFRCHVSRAPASHPFHSLADGQPDLSLFKLAVVFCSSAKGKNNKARPTHCHWRCHLPRMPHYILHGFDTAIHQQVSVLEKQ
jgi:hypothetical protein